MDLTPNDTLRSMNVASTHGLLSIALSANKTPLSLGLSPNETLRSVDAAANETRLSMGVAWNGSLFPVPRVQKRRYYRLPLID
eukprot:2009397-Pyramimonas_sp.AAC.1